MTSLVATNVGVPAPRSAESCPANGAVTTPAPPAPDAVDPAEAEEFLTQFYVETSPSGSIDYRMWQVRHEIDATGSYTHTVDELTYGARVAWRNSARCIGRLYWNSLRLRDRRHVTVPADVAAECVEHLRDATRGGQIRSTITVFAQDRPHRPGPRIHNDQLVRYAGHRTASGEIRGDGRYAGFTDRAVELGLATPRAARPVRRAAVAGLRGRGRAGDLRRAGRRRAGGPARPSRPRVVRRAASAVARGAGDQQHAAGRRRA